MHLKMSSAFCLGLNESNGAVFNFATLKTYKHTSNTIQFNSLGYLTDRIKTLQLNNHIWNKHTEDNPQCSLYRIISECLKMTRQLMGPPTRNKDIAAWNLD